MLGMHFVIHGIYRWPTCNQNEFKKPKDPFDVSNTDMEAISTDLFHCLSDTFP